MGIQKQPLWVALAFALHEVSSVVYKLALGLNSKHQKIHNAARDTAAVAHNPERLDMYTWGGHAVSEIFRHVDALLAVIPTPASATTFCVDFASDERFVIFLLWDQERFVCKLLAIEDTTDVLFDVELDICIDGNQPICQLWRATEAYIISCGS